jgi:AcrR family transcriptional regulator
VTQTLGSAQVPYAELTRGLLHDRMLEAVGQLLADRPWSKVTMAAVAARVGVSRQTVYNTFGSRQELARAYVDREADRFLAGVDVAVSENAAQPRDALAAALTVFLGAARQHPLVRAITATEGGDELLPLVTTRGGPLIDHVTEHLTGLLVETWPVLRPGDAVPIADVLVRLAISYAALPAGDPSRTAQTIAGILGPSVDELLG